MKIEEAIAMYLDELRRRNYAARTLQEYGYDLGDLCRFLEGKNLPEVEKISSTVLSDYQRWLFYQPTEQGTARSVGTQNKKIAPVRGLFRFLTVEGIVMRDPAKDLERGREPRRLPRNILTPREAKRILDGIATDTVKGYRARVILEVFYATGIRRNELINLRVGDVNLDEELLTVREGKGGHDRVVPLSSMACRFLETYLKGIRPKIVKNPNDDHLFLSMWGKIMDKDALNVMIKRHTRQAGVKKHVTCHVWRHTCATHLVQNNANLRHVQEMLGHRSLTTTERYLQLTVTDLKQAHRKFHPREKA
jgi:integrase/recombinase XerD